MEDAALTTSAFIRSDKIGEHLTCPICMELFENPKVLVPCLHTLCEKCVLKLHNHNKQFACPQCRQMVEVPTTGIKDLPTNFFINNLLYILLSSNYKKTPKPVTSGPQFCYYCEDEENAASYCHDCMQFLCDLHEQLHRKGKKSSTHQINLITEMRGTSRPKTPSVCSKHDNEQLKLFCEACDKPTCAFCILLEHKDHPYSFINEALEKNMPMMRKMMQALEDNAMLVENTISDITATDQLLNQQKHLIKHNIKRYAEELKKTIDFREKELLDQLEKLADSNSQSMNFQKIAHETTLASLKSSLDISKATIESNSTLEILSVKSLLQNQLRDFKQVHSPEKRRLSFAIDENVLAMGKLSLKEEKHKLQLKEIVANFGEQGADVGQLKSPLGLAVDCIDRIFVVDRDNHRVQAFKQDGTFLFQLKPYMTPEGTPLCIAIDTSNRIFLGLWHTKHVQVYNSEGIFMYEWDRGSVQPQSISVNSKEEVIICESKKNQISVFETNGAFKFSFGSAGSNDGQFNQPYYTAVDQRNNNILVSDTYNHRVQVFNSKGEFLFKFGSEGKGQGQFRWPTGIVAASGRIIVGDFGNGRIQVFDDRGNYLFGSDKGPKLSTPRALALTTSDHVVVTSENTHCVYVLD